MGNELDEQKGSTTDAVPSPEIMYPALLDRVKAIMIDTLVILALSVVAANTFDRLEEVSSMTKAISFFVIFWLYDPLMTSLTKGTIGHKMIGLQVVRADKMDKKIFIGLAFLRFLIKGVLGWISFLGVLGSKRKRALHDTLSGSIVIYAPKKKRAKKERTKN